MSRSHPIDSNTLRLVGASIEGSLVPQRGVRVGLAGGQSDQKNPDDQKSFRKIFLDRFFPDVTQEARMLFLSFGAAAPESEAGIRGSSGQFPVLSSTSKGGSRKLRL